MILKETKSNSMNHRLSYFSFLIFLINAPFLCGQIEILQGEITFKNGEKLVGWVEIPEGADDTKIRFSETAFSPQKEIASSELSKIKITQFSNEIVFENLLIEKYYPPERTVKILRKSKWLLVLNNTEKMNSYSSAPIYELKDERVSSNNTDDSAFTALFFYLKKTTNPNAFLAHEYRSDSKKSKKFVRNMTYYLSDCPLLVEQIKDYKYSWSDLLKIAVAYSFEKKS